MYNCINEAIRYLNSKYTEESIIEDPDDLIIQLLIKQYYYGMAAKRDLYYKLISLNIIKEN
jgi:hypothetical protein